MSGGKSVIPPASTIRTPAASIGIRGGIATVMLPLPLHIVASDPNLARLQGVLVLSHFGQTTLSNNADQVTLTPGFATVVGSPNAPIPPPFRLSDATLQLIMQALGSGSGQRGAWRIS